MNEFQILHYHAGWVESVLSVVYVVMMESEYQMSSINLKMDPPPGDSSEPMKQWAMATLVTHSAGKTSGDHTLTYTHPSQSMLLAYQFRELYPLIQMLALLAEDQISEVDARMLENAGYVLNWRSKIVPAGVKPLEGVYSDQYMKFWLWNLTIFEFVVYIDSDTYFNDPSRLDFEASFSDVSVDSVVACPTVWSKMNEFPVTWNGGFFILRPSETHFKRFLESEVPTTHFRDTYPQNYAWFDQSEMGFFMRDFPVFTMPRPLSVYCLEIMVCCVEQKCRSQFAENPVVGAMVHGLKPFGKMGTDGFGRLYDHQIQRFSSWGYNSTCLIEFFYKPLTALFQKHGLLPKSGAF